MAAELSAGAALQVEQTLAERFRWLVFPRELEARYAQDTSRTRIQQLRQAGYVIAGLINLFLVSDHAMVPDRFEDALWLRTLGFTGLTLLGLQVLGHIHQVLSRELFVASSAVLASLIHIYLCLTSQSDNAQAYMVGLAMIIFYTNVFSRMRFWVVLALNGVQMGLFALACVQFPNPHWQLLLPIGLVLGSTATFTAYYLYSLEYEDRHNYLLALRQRELNSELTIANDELERVSRTDALTQVANRRHFDEFFAQVWSRAVHDNERVSILMLDVDHFKQYNDRYGHQAGDACLESVAQALRQSVRRPGDLVARYGGEEFIVLLYRTPADQVQAAAERVRASVEALAVPHEGSPLYGRVTVSLGVASVQAGDRHASPQRLIQQADQALYQAKNRGRNRVWPQVEELVS